MHEGERESWVTSSVGIPIRRLVVGDGRHHRVFEEFGIAAGAGGLYYGLMDYRTAITIEPGKRGGKPCIRGLRITVYDVLEYLASGMSEAEILADFPDLTAEDIRACLAFAADRERRLMSSSA
jgi:uncharacterized protein (DUF433 family)